MELTDIVRIIWSDMVASPTGTALGVSVIILFLFKDQLKECFSLFIKRKASKYEKSEYSKKDVLNHPILRDLKYWIETGIDLVKIERSYAKELIMKDVLKLKFTVIKEVLEDYFNKLDDDSKQDLKKIFTEMLRDVDSKQILGWRNIGIPEIFIKKYLAVQQLGNEVVHNTIKVFLSESVCASDYTKIYLILSILDAHLTNIYANAVSTALSLNGDLNGIIYKGVIIGSNSSMFAVDCPVSQDIINNRLDTLLNKLQASRAGIVMFHAYSGSDFFNGKFSVVYERSAHGVSDDRKDYQYMPAYLISDLQEPFENNKMVSGGLKDFSYGLSTLMSQNGTEVLVCYPLFVGKDLKGFIKVDWMLKLKYNEVKKSTDIESELIKSSQDIKNLILGNLNENTR